MLLRTATSGFVLAVGFQAALFAQQFDAGNLFAAIISAIAGVAVALLVRQNSLRMSAVATIGTPVVGYAFTRIAARLDIPFKLACLADPFMAKIGHFTVNKNLTITFTLAIFLVVSSFAFMIALFAIPSPFRQTDTTIRHTDTTIGE